MQRDAATPTAVHSSVCKSSAWAKQPAFVATSHASNSCVALAGPPVRMRGGDPHRPVASKQQKAAAPRRPQRAPLCHAPWAAALARASDQGLHRASPPAAPPAAPAAALRSPAATPRRAAARTSAPAGGTGAHRWSHARCHRRTSRGMSAACRHHTAFVVRGEAPGGRPMHCSKVLISNQSCPSAHGAVAN